MLAKLEPFNTPDIADLRPYLATIPDPRSRRGRWYPLTCLLTICACAVISGARTIEEIAEWVQRAPDTLLEAIGVRPTRCAEGAPRLRAPSTAF